LLDAQFTSLDTQFHDLQQVLTSIPSTHTRRAWQLAARQMRATTSRISRVSYRMYSQYQTPSRHLRYRMFALLHRKAHVLHAGLVEVTRARSRKQARVASRKAQRAMLDLVLQYQAISGGYAAASCGAQKWNCGVEKNEPRTIGYPALGVKWTCVPRAAACRGILGPRAPMLAQPPLTVVTTAH
jgi:hypothetical protein